MKRARTRQVGKLTPEKLENIRKANLKTAKTKSEERYINSKKFITDVRKKIKENRVKENIKTIERLSTTLNLSSDAKKVFRNIYGEKTRVKDGKVVRVNKLNTLKQTLRLKKTASKIKKGTYNIKQVLSRNEKYKMIKKYSNDASNLSTFLSNLNREEFYFKERDTIMQYNKAVKRYGRVKAGSTKIGKALKNKYIEDINENTENLLDVLKD